MSFLRGCVLRTVVLRGMLFVGIVTSVGCLWPWVSSCERVDVPEGVSVELFRPDLLRRGGALEIRLLTPGKEASATDLFDRFVLMVVRGIVDALEEGPGRLSIFLSEEGAAPELVMDGRCDLFQVPGWMGRLLLKNDVDVRFRIEVRRAWSDELLAQVLVKRKFSLDPKTFDRVSYGIGQEIVGRLLE